MRSQWATLPDAQLLAQCEVDTYRASGPGGQKRNKTSSAVRLRHTPSGLMVIAEESRSQHENKAKALVRIRRALFLEIRENVAGLSAEVLATRPELIAAKDSAGRFSMSAKNPAFWPMAGLALDVLFATQGQVSTAAEYLGTSTANFIAFLQTDPKLWQVVNHTRAQFQLKSLK